MSQSLLNRAHPRTTTAKLATANLAPGGARYLAGVWILLAVLTPLVGFLGARGFAPAVGFAGLLCLPLARPRTTDMVGLILFGLLVEWAVISAFWSPAPLPHDLKSFGRFTGLHLFQQLLFCGALIMTTRGLTPAGARKALIWVGYGLIALILVLVAESFTEAALFRSLQPLVGKQVEASWGLRSVAQGGYVLVMLFWPVTIGLWRGGRRYLAGAFAGGATLALVLLHVSAPLAALIASAALFALVAWLRRPAAIAGGVLAVAQSLAVPWLMRGWAEGGVFQSLRPHLPVSWAARVDIWSFTSQRMVEKPLFGWGLDASRTFKGHIPLHPHDVPLQLWFELGAVGAILGALIWAFIFWRFAESAPRRPLYAAAGCATALSAMIIGAFSFSLWQEWWICLVALGFAACAVLARQLDDPALKQRSDSANKHALKQRSDSAKVAPVAKILPLLAGLAAMALALPAQARPYLMLNADDQGFQALDLGGVDRAQPGVAQATLIDAPLAGVMTGGQLAPLVERRVEIDCAQPRWRVLSTAWLDGKEQPLGQDQTPRPWTAFAKDDPASAAQAAACRREYRPALVSRYLNLGEILANFQAAHAKPAPQRMTEKEIRDHRFRNGH